MHPGQITVITAALTATLITLVAYMHLKSSTGMTLSSQQTWNLNLHENGEPDQPQTWYIDADNGVMKIVTADTDSGSLMIEELYADGVATYSEMDESIDTTVPSSFCDEVDLEDGMTCESYIADVQADIDSMKGYEAKDNCIFESIDNPAIDVSNIKPGQDNLIGEFNVAIDASGIPTAIKDPIDGTIIATIESVVDGIEGAGSITKCEVDDSRMHRDLGYQEYLSNTDWCGAGTNIFNTPCPEDRTRGSLQANRACRRHDHGRKYESAGPGTRMECQNDKHLASASSNWAVQAVFGKWGISQAWGCFNWKHKRRCTRNCGWRGCRRTCTKDWGWDVKYGPWRFNNINNRGDSQTYVAKCKTCSGDLF